MASEQSFHNRKVRITPLHALQIGDCLTKSLPGWDLFLLQTMYLIIFIALTFKSCH